MDKRTFNLMWLGSGTGSRYWLFSLNGDGTDIVNDLAIDSLNNIYIIGYTNGVGYGSNDIFLAKISNSGILQWQIVLGDTNSNQGNGIAIDTSDNIYIIGDSDSNMYIAKYNTSGILQWQRSLDGSSTESGHKITTDSSGNLYVIGTTDSKGAGNYDILLAKYNSSGTLQWQRTYGGADVEAGNDITIDTSGNIYFTGSTSTIRTTALDLVLVKYTSTGSITWQRSLGGKESPKGDSIITDSTGNIYVVGNKSNNLAPRNLLIAKYNSSGTIQWQKTIQGTEANQDYKIGIDSDNNIYILSIKDDDNKMYMSKLNSSGSFIWQRSIGNGSDFTGGIKLNSLNDIIVTWKTGIGTTYGIYIAKLPNDGSKLGTYGDVIYANVTLNMVSNTFFSNTITLTNNTSINLTDNTSVSLSQMDANLTSNLIKI